MSEKNRQAGICYECGLLVEADAGVVRYLPGPDDGGARSSAGSFACGLLTGIHSRA